MSKRSFELARRLELGALALDAFASSLTEFEWQSRVPGDGLPAHRHRRRQRCDADRPDDGRGNASPGGIGQRDSGTGAGPIGHQQGLGRRG